MEAELAHVETELRNLECSIVQGVVGKTTTALLQDREGPRRPPGATTALTDRSTVITMKPVDDKGDASCNRSREGVAVGRRRSGFSGAPGRSRTCDPRIRSARRDGVMV